MGELDTALKQLSSDTAEPSGLNPLDSMLPQLKVLPSSRDLLAHLLCSLPEFTWTRFVTFALVLIPKPSVERKEPLDATLSRPRREFWSPSTETRLNLDNALLSLRNWETTSRNKDTKKFNMYYINENIVLEKKKQRFKKKKKKKKKKK